MQSLFSFVDDNVRNELKNRTSEINSYDSNSINSTHGKIAYATVRGASITLGTNVDNSKLYHKNNNYLPHGMLNNVKISNDGDYGSLKKASFTFTVFNKNQLDYYEKDFMIPTKPIEIFYGWSNKKYDSVNTGKFTGLIYNFSFDLNGDGSFSCTTEAVGEGYFISGLNLNTDIKNDSSLEDGKDSKLLINNIFTLIEYNIKTALQTGSKDYYPEFNLAKFSMIKEWKNTTNSSYNKNTVQNEQRWYIELIGLVNLINKNLLIDRNVKIKVDALSFYDRYIRSANPLEIIFPDMYMGKYSDSITYNINSNFKIQSPLVYDNPDKESTVDLGKTLISIDYIKTLASNYDSGIILKDFFRNIFSTITDNSGGYYRLTLSTNTDSKTEPEYLIIRELNYASIPPDTNFHNKIYLFEPFTKNSIVKSYSLSSKLPDTLASALYLGNSSEINDNIKDLFLGNEIAGDQNKSENEEIDYKAINDNINKNDFIKLFDDGLKNESLNKKTRDALKLVSDIDKAAYLVSINPSDDTYILSLKTALTTYANKNNDSPITNNILLPLNLSISIDGINGFKFGNIISSTYLPSKYINNKNKIVFIITKITDTIDNGIWTTDLETQCNLLDK